MTQFKLAIRNVIRHKRRSGVAIIAIAFGVMALLLSGGFIEWILWSTRESYIESQSGHVQLTKRGYFDKGAAAPFEYLLPVDLPILNTIRQSANFKAMAPRLSFGGLISHGDTSISFLGEGVDPKLEANVSHELHIIKGAGFSSEETAGILIGTGLAKSLGVEVGDPVVLMTNAGDKGFNAIETPVDGIFLTADKSYDDSVARIPIGLARKLLRISGNQVWVILLDKTEHTGHFTESLKRLIAELRITDLEVVPWNERADFYNKTARLFTRQMSIVRVIIGVIIVLTISNVLIMSVFERTREIGTVMALGLKHRNVMHLFVAEGTVLGLFGGVVGAVVGVSLAEIISKIGIPMPPPPGMTVGYTAEIRVTTELVVGSLVLALGTTVVASIYPAWKAANLQIVDALRHGR
ncbi:FtsX-like permease family protein [Methylococcus sp. EFPC2]|uniref:ABC transporter permease n=1 Tax=Methylococcus sp. EFPC2 TaxID=2812648 RepID=UPI0019689313|nr:FtsX-like permease family protein [Methylococcus sp. EFPC2]QSA95692.1 ABC transporter permease [Methylococcus sp. EFPC2]